MALDINNLDGALGEVLNSTREITDPWGFGITAVIKSTADSEWQQWELERVANSRQAQNFRKVQARVMLPSVSNSGFRAAKKLTASQGQQLLEDEFAKPGDLKTDINTLRDRKPGIAKILLVSLSGITEGGQPVDLSTPELRLARLDHAAYQIKAADGTLQEYPAPLYRRNPDGSKATDETGQPIELPHGGKNLGDAIAFWIFGEAEDNAAFVVERKVQVLDSFRPTSTTSTETGSPSSTPSASE